MPEIPLSLVSSIESGKCVLFLGAGIGFNVTSGGKRLPTGKELAHELCDRFSIERNDDLILVSSVVEMQTDRDSLESYLATRFRDAEPDDDLKWLLSLQWRSVYTTNYDESIKRAYEQIRDIKKKPVFFTLSREVKDYHRNVEMPVIYLHGILYGERLTNIVITKNDYHLFKSQREMLFDLLKMDSTVSTVLYVGYSNSDPNWETLLRDLKDQYHPAELPRAFRVSPSTNTLEEMLLKSDGIETIPQNLTDFVSSLKSQLSDSISDFDLEKLKAEIPPDFHSLANENIAPFLRLFTSWVYVNQAPFEEKRNLDNFLKGDKPSWSLIGTGDYFERDLEEDLYNECLDYITSPMGRPSVLTVLAPAGYGMTSLLMALSVRLIKENAAPIFYLKEVGNFLDGDIEFALSATNGTAVFIVDNAARFKTRIANILHKFRENKRQVLFVLGSRKNEWNQFLATSPGGKEFEIEILSDREIGLLLGFLKKHSSLGVLNDLSPELQRAAVKNNLGQELLVTMRETTEGRSFDAILEDEYRGISDACAQEIYLSVCCFYQNGNILRTSLLAQLLNLKETELHPILNQYLDGVIVDEDINVSRGIYGVRPRHKKIAQIVWERCGESLLQESILQKALGFLNLTHKSDRDAFESFIRTDSLVDSISSLEGKTKFFETACRKDPKNMYVFQHYARMFSREKRFSLALGQIDKALEINPKRILHHTKGEILSDLAFNSESIDIARKHLIQSEVSFRNGLKIKANDEYCIHGLANIFFRWAKFIEDHDVSESAEYLAKAEREITEGINSARNKEALWILSSDISHYIGDNPKQIDSLLRAVESSHSTHLSRYLLARVYNKNGEYAQAKKVVEPAITDTPDDFRLALEYAKSILGLNLTNSEAIAVLNLAAYQGTKDPRFISILAGLYFIEKNFSKYRDTVGESKKQSFSIGERREVHFVPADKTDPSKPLYVRGKIVHLARGAAWIQTDGIPMNVICPGSKWGDTILKEQSDVKCELQFNSEGALAVNPKVMSQ